MTTSNKIVIVGLWHLGEIYSACLAELGHQVVGLDSDRDVIDNLSRNIPPLPEPQLEDLLVKNRKAGRLRYTSDFSEIKNADILWFTFDTPIDENDNADTQIIYEALEKSLPHLKNSVLLVVTSQVPAGTSKKIKTLILQRRPELKFDYVYSPENLRLGEAVKCFFEPGRIVIGAETEGAFRKMEEIFSGLNAELIKMSPASAEMAKHAINAFFATSISFISDVADACEEVGADVMDVTKALKSEPRIGPKAFLNAGLGFSGGTLGRDLKSLLALADFHSISLPVIESVLIKNQKRGEAIKDRLGKILGGFKNKTIAVFGLTYKPGTRTLRRSFAIEFAKMLQKEGAIVRLYDPQALAEEVSSLITAEFFKDPYQAAESSEAVVLMTTWPQFKELDFAAFGNQASKKAVFFDTSNFLYDKKDEIKNVGFKYIGIGR